MRVLGVSSYPKEAAATRFRMEQFVDPLKQNGVELVVRPFLRSHEFVDLYREPSVTRNVFPFGAGLVRRFRLLFEAGKFDLLFVQREAMPIGPAIFEWLYQVGGRLPMILDLDDATYLPYSSPNFGSLGSALKFFGKTDNLIKSSRAVICGNRFIAEHVENLGTRAVVIPTIVDTEKFHPTKGSNQDPVIGWIGTHSTYPSLEFILPVLKKLAERYRFRLHVVGAGRDLKIDGMEIENLEWALGREVVDFQSLDIGLYPMAESSSADKKWLSGKSGFKAIEYMAVGVPFVMSPVGVCAEIGIEGETHFNARGPEDWYNSLELLLTNAELRRRMGERGREFSVANYRLTDHAEMLKTTLVEAAERAAGDR